jgi:biotin carboxyl carrier protein
LNLNSVSTFYILNSIFYLCSVSKITVNKNSVFEIEQTPGGILIDGNPLTWDVVELAEGYFHILLNHKSYRAEVVKADMATKTFTFKINNHLHSVEVKDKFDLLLEKLGMHNTGASKVNSIKAPMPGLIIDLKVKEGDTVKAGDALLILEAMKMENMLKSPGDGVVKSVKVKKGDAVEKNQVLLEF